ncbi:MAG: hypothetical protein J4F32_03275 [Dehalococcoidia bacterium]|nr:hypothetical protein [Dehalococcoidia bacterium]
MTTASGLAHAQERTNQLGGELQCPPGISIVLPVRGVTFDPGVGQLELDVTLCNGSAETQQALLEVSGVPDDWRIALRPIFGPYEITSITLPGGVSKDFRLRLTPLQEEGTSEFQARLNIVSPSGELLGAEVVSVQRGSIDRPPGEEVLARATFNALRGPTTSQFGFDIAITNRTSENVTLELGSLVPTGWTVTFTPAVGEQKLISSVTVIPRGIERITTTLSPNRDALPGGYRAVFEAASEEFFLEVPLQVVLTGVPDLLLTTPNQRLNLDAVAGQATPAAIRLVNIGTAAQPSVNLLADAPPGWEVTFEVDSVVNLEAEAIADISLEITPPANLVPGDYAITIRARNPLVDESFDFRVRVLRATIWGWVGIGIVIVVMGSLVGLFLRLGRR